MATLDLGKVVPEKGIDYFTESEINDIESNVTTAVKADLDFDATIADINSDINDLQTNKADKTEIPDVSSFITKDVNNLTNYYKMSETYNKTEIDTKISSVYKYKGSVATYGDLPSQDNVIGDTYNVEADGANYSWNGIAWDKLGGDIDLSDYYQKSQVDTLLGGKQNTINSANKITSDYVDDSLANNKFVTTQEKNTWNGKQDALTFDNVPTENSNNPVKSGGVYSYVNTLIGDIDSVLDVINGEVI